jgi:ABC-type amino acid transport substrate-binding protein
MKFFIVLVMISTYLSAEMLKIAFSRSSNEPYVKIDKRQLTGGVLKEFVDLISKQSGVKVEYVLVSKRNQEKAIVDGIIDGVCLLNPSDVQNSQRFIWSDALYKEEDVLIVRREDASSLNSLKSLSGHKLGTIASHTYPALQPYFNNHSIERIENKKLVNNINQLRYGVIDAVVDTKLAVGYCISKKNVEDKFIVSNKNIDEQELHCMFRKDKGSSLVKLNLALSTLKERGVFDKIINKYRSAL